MYYIIRINFKGETEAHSIETREEYRAALTRYHNIIAADLGNSEVNKCYTFLMNQNAQTVVEPFSYNRDVTEDGDLEVPFDYAVIRTFTNINGQISNSIEFKNFSEAQKRYFNIIASDLQNNQLTFNMAAIIDGDGNVIEGRSFNHEVEE